MNFEIGDTVYWKLNYEGIVTDIIGDICVVDFFKPRRVQVRLVESELELINPEINLKPEDYTLLNELFIDLALLTCDKAWFLECIEKK